MLTCVRVSVYSKCARKIRMPEVLQFNCERAAVRLDVFLAARLDGLSRMRIAHLLEAGACTVNGATGAAGQRVGAGDVVEVVLADDAPSAMTPEPLPLAVVYEDEELLVVDKPAGLLMHPTRGVKSGTLANALAYHLNGLRTADVGLQIEGAFIAAPEVDQPAPARVVNEQSDIRSPQSFIRPGLVHRLDRATSGLVVVAKTQRALSILTRHFHHRLVEKRYRALVYGRVAQDEFEIDAPIGRDETRRPQWNMDVAGKVARTRLRVVERCANATLVELEPVTGRTNQLRIHCTYAGHPIVGDEWYGGAAEQGALTAGRLCLHAARLAFNHPSGGRWLEFTSPLPVAFAALVEEARGGPSVQVFD